MEYREKVYIFQAEIRRISWRSKKYAPNDERSLDSTKKSIYSARSIFSFDSKKVFYIMPRNYVFLWQISSQKHFKSSNISSGRPIKKLDDISRLLWWLSSSWRHFSRSSDIFSRIVLYRSAHNFHIRRQRQRIPQRHRRTWITSSISIWVVR